MDGEGEAIRAQVLIVEDEPDHADVMADALRKPGHVCTIVHSVAEALAELKPLPVATAQRRYLARFRELAG